MELLMNQTNMDLEPYNYIFNKNTFFLDKDVYNTNTFCVESVLATFEKDDPMALMLLNYS